MKAPALLLPFLDLFLTFSLAAAETVKVGQFEAQLAEDNAWLPSSIRWVKGDVELLRQETGLNFSFTSFENRNKIYHEENRNIWKGKSEPRFLTDAKVVSKEACRDGEFSGVKVCLESSYARHQRRLQFHDSLPRLSIVYSLEFTRDVVLHEAIMMGVGIRFDEGFDQLTLPDAREVGAAPLTTTGWKNPSHSAGFLHAGPELLVNPAKGTAVLILDSHSGERLERPSVNLLFLRKGQKVEFSVEMLLAAKEDPAVMGAFEEAAARMPAGNKPFLLVAAAQLLAQRGNLKEAEAALLEAARLNVDYATPYAALAALRRDHKLPGEAEAWLEAGYRMPFNYGYMLSGSGFTHPALTEEQRRLHVLNVLIAVENNAFYPDYYLWAARGFLKMDLQAQACAMYRQALWATDHMPRTEATRQKLREECQKKIAELEGPLKDRPRANPPPPSSRVFDDPALTGEQRHLGMFAVLASADGVGFSPEYTLRAADGFRKLDMPVQACAMCRQALWAVDAMVGGEETRRKWRDECRKKLVELEEILKTQTATHLPPMIPIRLPAK